MTTTTTDITAARDATASYVMECDQVTVTVLVDNFIDMLIPSHGRVQRQGMPEHFAARRGTPLAENGISFLVETVTGTRSTTTLFDAGITGAPLLHNAQVLGVDLREVDQVVLSHGHPDHFGGIYDALAAIGREVPLVVHPAAFRPRSINRADTTLLYFNACLTMERLTAAGAAVMAAHGPVSLGPGVTTSGEIPTRWDFEEEVPAGRVALQDGIVGPDSIDDYLCLVVNVRGLGLIVLDPCGHAGVISAVTAAQEVAGQDRVHAVMGGFHLGHEGVSQTKIDRTVDELIRLSPDLVSPMHCSGLRSVRAVAERMPDAFLQMTAATRITFAGDS